MAKPAKGKNVVVFGESGSGKSSAVNMILGREAANVSDKAVGCTFEFSRYERDDFVLFDTVGLSEGNQGTVSQSFAVSKLVKLLKSLEDGVSLLIFVMEKGRIKKSLDENYKLFADAICMSKVPVLLLITHCEMEEQPGKWWKENKHYFDKYGMNFVSAVSGCCLKPEKVPPPMRSHIKTLNEDTVANVIGGILKYMLSPGWQVVGGWKNWFASILSGVMKIFKRMFGLHLVWPDNPEDETMEDRIYNYFIKHLQYDPVVAKQTASEIALAIR